jgi:glycosyltransferase involved in cell wall biosynthesis
VLITDALRNIILKQNHSFDHKIHVLSDGANIQYYNEESKKLMGSFKKNIGYIGHLYDGRGIEMMIELACDNPLKGFHLIGGNETDIARWKKVALRIENIFFYGYKAHHELAAYAINFDILVAPYQGAVSVNKGSNTVNWMSPLKIFEYMSYQKPFICSDLPVLREVLTDNHNCLLAEYNNKQSWQCAINRIYSDSDLAAKIVEGAKSDLEHKYSWKSRASKIVASLSS